MPCCLATSGWLRRQGSATHSLDHKPAQGFSGIRSPCAVQVRCEREMEISSSWAVIALYGFAQALCCFTNPLALAVIRVLEYADRSGLMAGTMLEVIPSCGSSQNSPLSKIGM